MSMSWIRIKAVKVEEGYSEDEPSVFGSSCAWDMTEREGEMGCGLEH